MMSPSDEGSSRGVPPCPLFVRLNGARVVVVGAGHVATRKIESLLSYGAHVSVIAKEATEDILAWARVGEIDLVLRAYGPGDLEGAFLVVAATSDPETNEAVYGEARRRGLLVNVVDVPELCNFIVPSVLRRGKLQVAVSTDGAAPSVARELRLELEELYPSWWEPYIDLLADVRTLVKERVQDNAEQRSAMLRVLGAVDLRRRFAAGERPEVAAVYNELVALVVEEGVA